jgi:hypothetical protein
MRALLTQEQRDALAELMRNRPPPRHHRPPPPR